MKKILITGANGFLGQHLSLFLLQHNIKVITIGRGSARIPFERPFTYENVDLTNKTDVEKLLLKHQPDVIIHSAAMSKPDECNNQQDACRIMNVEATKALLRYQPDRFIYISSDFVFGEGGPHAEEDAPAPLNFYGKTKLMAEEVVMEGRAPFVIIRPVFMYGKVWNGLRPTFLQWVKSNIEQGKPLKVVSDQLRMPSFVTDICKAINSVIEKNAQGIFHLAGKEVLSPYDMAVITADTLGLNSSLIESVTSETFPEPVKRAKNQGLKINKAIRELGYSPVSFIEGVRLTFDK